MAFTAPHDPRNPPEPFRQAYYDNPPPLPGNFLLQHPFDNGQAAGAILIGHDSPAYSGSTL